ncbi:hypothetical protein ACOSQ4_020730 [Xanthoceras sorbifolium]
MHQSIGLLSSPWLSSFSLSVCCTSLLPAVDLFVPFASLVEQDFANQSQFPCLSFFTLRRGFIARLVASPSHASQNDNVLNVNGQNLYLRRAKKPSQQLKTEQSKISLASFSKQTPENRCFSFISASSTWELLGFELHLTDLQKCFLM